MSDLDEERAMQTIEMLRERLKGADVGDLDETLRGFRESGGRPEREEPTYETYNVSDVNDALQQIRKQFLAGEPLVWTGPDKLHFSVAAMSPEPSWHFSPEGLEAHADQDRDFWDVWALVAFQIGFHNGVLRENEYTKAAQRDAEFWREIASDARRKEARGGS